jgi:hypothetical protein
MEEISAWGIVKCRPKWTIQEQFHKQNVCCVYCSFFFTNNVYYTRYGFFIQIKIIIENLYLVHTRFDSYRTIISEPVVQNKELKY